MFCNIPTSYSYWCSHLNQTTHIAQSSNHFPYSVALSTKGYTVSRLCTQAPEEAASQLHFWLTLSHFRGLFKDYTPPNIFISFITYSWTDNSIFKERFRTFPNLFYKVTTFIFICQVLCELFFSDLITSIFHYLQFQIFYKVKFFIWIKQELCVFFYNEVFSS